MNKKVEKLKSFLKVFSHFKHAFLLAPVLVSNKDISNLYQQHTLNELLSMSNGIRVVIVWM